MFWNRCKWMQTAIDISHDQMEITNIQGTEVRYLIHEADTDQPPLLICNGLGQSIEILLPLIDVISDRTIIAFDMPGTGRSAVNNDVQSMSDYAGFTLAFMDKIGVEQFDILGISWGGAVTQQIAYDAPERVRKLVLAITSAGGIGSWWGTPIALSEIMFPMRYFNKTYGDFIGPWMYGGEAVLNPRMFQEYSKHAIRPTSEGYFGQVRAMCSWTSLSWLDKLKQPTLIIAGQFDGLIPITNQILLAHKMQNARLKVFQAGHLLMYTQRHEVGPMVSSFLK